jgi:hypothetical protein
MADVPVKGMLVIREGPTGTLKGRIAEVRTTGYGKKIITFEYEQPGSKGNMLVSHSEVGDPNYTFYAVPPPIPADKLEELAYQPGVGPKYFEAKESFERSRTAGRRRRRKTLRRRK